MQLPKECIDEFKQLYQEYSGIEISDAEALDQATKLLSLMSAVFRPISHKNTVPPSTSQ